MGWRDAYFSAGRLWIFGVGVALCVAGLPLMLGQYAFVVGAVLVGLAVLLAGGTLWSGHRGQKSTLAMSGL